MVIVESKQYEIKEFENPTVSFLIQISLLLKLFQKALVYNGDHGDCSNFLNLIKTKL